MSDEIIAALIGAGSALVVIIIKDIVLDLLSKRNELRTQLISQRIEKAYAPLDYLLYIFETNDSKREGVREEINNILKQYGYLLTEKTLSGFYILVDGENADISNSDTVNRFIHEYKNLRRTFYKSHAGIQDIYIGRNRNTGILTSV